MNLIVTGREGAEAAHFKVVGSSRCVRAVQTAVEPLSAPPPVIVERHSSFLPFLVHLDVGVHVLTTLRRCGPDIDGRRTAQRDGKVVFVAARDRASDDVAVSDCVRRRSVVVRLLFLCPNGRADQAAKNGDPPHHKNSYRPLGGAELRCTLASPSWQSTKAPKRLPRWSARC